MRWKAGDWFLNCHVTSKPVSRTRVVPMMHFKFTADLGRKIEYALATGGYNQGSRSYRLYATLIARMREARRSFLAPVSRRYTSARDFLDAGVARWPSDAPALTAGPAPDYAELPDYAEPSEGSVPNAQPPLRPRPDRRAPGLPLAAGPAAAFAGLGAPVPAPCGPRCAATAATSSSTAGC